MKIHSVLAASSLLIANETGEQRDILTRGVSQSLSATESVRPAVSHVDTFTQHRRGTEIERLDDDFFIPGPGCQVSFLVVTSSVKITGDDTVAKAAVEETVYVFLLALQYHTAVYHAISNIPVSNLGYISSVDVL